MGSEGGMAPPNFFGLKQTARAAKTGTGFKLGKVGKVFQARDGSLRGTKGVVDTPCVSECSAGEISCGGIGTGSLGELDCQLNDGSSYDLWTLEVETWSEVEIWLESGDLDPYLIVTNENCGSIAENDDDEGSNSRLALAMAPGVYFIFANSFAAGEVGDYVLSVGCGPLQMCESTCETGKIACGDSVVGTLDATDCNLPDDETLVEVWEMTLDASTQIDIRLNSLDFDTFLLVADANCAPLAGNDDFEPGVSTDSGLSITLSPGTYHIIANSFNVGDTGEYSLTVTCGNVEVTGQLPGDCNQDSKIDLSDPICLIQHLFLGRILPCEGTAQEPGAGNRALLDGNLDFRIDTSDVVFQLTYLFLGVLPHASGEDCVPMEGCPSLCSEILGEAR